jgi:protein tyrosine phosphatase (PTP) superfamily phosphohydrolase (DUF442 family)
MRSGVKQYAVLALGLGGLAGCGRGTPEVAVPEFTACALAGLANCRQAGDLTFGAQPTPETLQALAAQGYGTVVSTRGEGELDWDERALVESLGMKFVQIPMQNPVMAITDQQVVRLDSVLANVKGKTLLHCSSGNRVAGLYGVWLAEKQGLDDRTAIGVAEQAGMTGVRPVVETRLGR